MKLFLTLFAFCVLFFARNNDCLAQNTANKQISKDSTPIEDLDYHLSKDEFMYYYGKDDTARAIIHMFYRKRGLGVIDFVVLPIGSSIVGAIVAVVGEAAAVAYLLTGAGGLALAAGLAVGGTVISYVGFLGFPIYYIIQRSIYSRQKLIYVLVGRERGEKVSYSILDKLRDCDFR